MVTTKVTLPTVVPTLEMGFENRVLNTFKASRGRQLYGQDVIPILTNSGLWHIAKVLRPFWHSAEYLALEVLLKHKMEDPYDGLYAHLALTVGDQRRYGTVSFNWDRIRLTPEAKEYARSFQAD